MAEPMDDLRQASADVSGVQILSPAAQTVMDAAVAINDLVCTDSIAAALRAAADQVAPEYYNPPRGVSYPEKEAFVDGKCVRNEDIRYAILAIAAELEG